MRSLSTGKGRFLLVPVALLSLTCAWPEPGTEISVRLRLLDAATGAAVPGLVKFKRADGTLFVPQGLLRRNLGFSKEPWLSVLPAPRDLMLPREKISIEAFYGLETSTARVEVDLSAENRTRIDLPLRRFYDPRGRGLYAGNTHLHLHTMSRKEDARTLREEADRYLREIPRADGLDVVFLSNLERAGADHEYISNEFTAEDLKALSTSGVLFGNGEEHRHNFSPGSAQMGLHSSIGYGHVMLLNLPNLILPVSVGPALGRNTPTDGVPLRRGIDAARKDGGTVIWCHNMLGHEDIPNWVTGRLHAQNIFDGSQDLMRSYEDTFYRYLNAGLRVPFSTGTDWFIDDFSRAYVPVEKLSAPADWLHELSHGKSFITNGPFLEFSVEDLKPGDTVKVSPPGRVRVAGRGLGRADFRRLELVRDGKVVAEVPTKPADGHFVAELGMDLEIFEACWLALRIPPPPFRGGPQLPGHPRNEFGQGLFAHTSAVYVEVAGKKVFHSAAVQGLLEEVVASRAVIQLKGRFTDSRESASLLGVYDEAIRILESMPRRKEKGGK